MLIALYKETTSQRTERAATGIGRACEAILREMLEAFDCCERETVRVLCLRANGKHFCAGANVK